MALPAAPPKYSSYSAMLRPIVRGSEPWAVYALQRAVGVTPATGTFGPQTLRKVKAFQTKYGLEADGIAGPATQWMILQLAGAAADQAHGLPVGVGVGFAWHEGGKILGATNWDVPGGVDCGPGQWRIVGPPFSLDRLKRAFRPYVALDHACAVLAERRADFKRRNGYLAGSEALRIAVLAHNWPAGADAIVRNYKGAGNWWRYVPEPDRSAAPGEAWPPAGYTRAEWAQEYPSRILSEVAGP